MNEREGWSHSSGPSEDATRIARAAGAGVSDTLTRQEPTPAAAAIFAAVAGIRGCCVGDLEGSLLDEHGDSARIRSGLGSSAVVARELGWIGSRLGLGTPQLVTTKGTAATLVTAYLGRRIITVDVEASRPLKNIEATLLQTDWASVGDWVVSDLEIEYFPADHPISVAAQRQPSSEPSLTALSEPASELTPVAAPSEPVPISARPDPLVAEECAALRRALNKGRLALATRSVENLRELPSPADHPFNTSDPGPMLQPLLTAIANVVAGDTQSGSSQLAAMRDVAQFGPSLQWAAQVWSARACAITGSGLKAALGFAESALRLTEQLDNEARAVSLLLLADVKNNSGDINRSLSLAAAARELFMEIGDGREESACWLLEARALSASNRDQESLQAAENARVCHPSWPAPVTFLIKRALRQGDLDEAERALCSLRTLTPIQPEAERDRLLIENVRSGVLPAESACQYLDLLDAPLGPRTLRQLQEIAASFPAIVQFRETLGWKLLRAGEPKAAKLVFQRLNTQDDLPDDVRSSVLLGLGFLAADEPRRVPSSVKLRAAVNAAVRYAGASASANGVRVGALTRRTDPMELRAPDALPGASLAQTQAEKAARREPRTGPKFSGTMRLLALPELLEVLQAGQKTGTLVCSSAAGIGAVHLRGGKVTEAAAPATGELRDYLIRRRAVTADQLRIIDQLPEDAQVNSLFDLTLLEHGLVTAEQVRDALRDQVLAALAEILGWSDGKFAFDPETQLEPPPSGVGIELDPQDLLRELRIPKDRTRSAR